MSESGENCVWSAEDIVNNASNWSLAADKNLLLHLHHLSEKILSNAARTNDNLVGFIDSLDRTVLSLDLANNQLENLHHTQFIESRVYEDEDEYEADEVADIQMDVNNKTAEEKTRKEIEEGLLQAIKSIEEYYEYKEVPNSDSDDETDSPNFVWQPKDPYLTRPLPSVIGTTEWYRKWHVGLLDDSSDDEDVTLTVKSAQTVKDDVSSDDDRYLPPLDRRSTIPSNNKDERNSQWRASDIINIDGNNGLNPMANSTLVDANASLFSEKGASLPIQEPNLSFAEQLAQKLGNIAQAQQSAQINTRFMNKTVINKNVNVFCDEPPPISADDDSDLSDNAIFGKPGLFGRSDAGLFDDVAKDDAFRAVSNITEENNDDLFAPKAPARMATCTYIPRSYACVPLFDDEPPELPKKKPVGGVAIFGNAGSVINNLRQCSGDNMAEVHVARSTKKPLVQGNVNTNENITEITNISRGFNKKSAENITENDINQQKSNDKVNLFDENDDLFEDDLFSNISVNKFTSSLFDDDSIDDNDSSGLFYSSTVKKNDDKTILFDKTQDKINNSRLFDDLSQKMRAIDRNYVNTDDIFDSSSNVKSDIFKSEPAANVFDKSIDLNVEKRNLFDNNEIDQFADDKNNVISKRTNIVSNKIEINRAHVAKRRNLFDDDVLTDATLPNAQITLDLKRNTTNRIRPNLFDDFDNESAGLFNDSSAIAKIDANVCIKTKEHAQNAVKEPILTKNIANASKNVAQPAKSVIIGDVSQNLTDQSQNMTDQSQNVTDQSQNLTDQSQNLTDQSQNLTDLSQNLTDQSIFDTPPDIEDDFDTDSDNILFNDENHLIYEDDPNELCAPVYRSSIFDEEPPLLPTDNAQNNKRTAISAIEAPPGDNVNNNECAFNNISIVDDVCTPQSSRRNISIHERLNSIETLNFDKMMDGPQENVRSAEIDQIFSDDSAVEDVGARNSVEYDEKLMKIEPVRIESLIDKSPKKLVIPAKIKHNLNINVAALLPASSRKPEMTKTLDENTTKTEQNLIDEFDSKTEILRCITKDRAKIPVKRRPSTRKGRTETLTKTHEETLTKTHEETPTKPHEGTRTKPHEGMGTKPHEETLTKPHEARTKPHEGTSTKPHETLTKPHEALTKAHEGTGTKPHEETMENNNKTIGNVSNRKQTAEIDLINQNVIVESAKARGAVKKAPLALFASSDSSDSDDIFNRKSPKSAINIPSGISKQSRDIFNGSKVQSVFDKQPVIKGDVFESPDYKKSRIFFDDDEETMDDYFSAKKLPPKSNIMRKSLFDDEEASDDLFQSDLFRNNSAKMSGNLKRAVKTKTFALTDATDDPLDLFK